MQKRAKEFLDNLQRKGNYLKRGIENYWEVSSRGNRKPMAETNARIVAYIEKHPGARPKEIEEELGLNSISDYLIPLIKIGILERVKDTTNGSAAKYFVKTSRV